MYKFCIDNSGDGCMDALNQNLEGIERQKVIQFWAAKNVQKMASGGKTSFIGTVIKDGKVYTVQILEV